MQFQALLVDVSVAADDNQVVRIGAQTHCGQRVAIRMTRRMARGIAAEIAELEGHRLINPRGRRANR